jgi:hypothetical protein
MRRFVTATPLDPARFRTAITACYASALELAPQPGELTAREHHAVAELDELFSSTDWLAGPRRPTPVGGEKRPRVVKVRAGVFTLSASFGETRVSASVVRGTLHEVHLCDRELNGSRDELERALAGTRLRSVGEVLAGFGEPGRRLGAAFATIDPGRL